MHRPPALTYLASRSGWHLRAIILLWVLGWLAFGFLVHGRAKLEALGWVLACLCLAGVYAWAGWRRAPSGTLRWDGQHWYWSGFASDTSCHVALLLDMQALMLVRLRSATGQQVWIWLHDQGSRTQWIALRRAVVASLKSDGKIPTQPGKEPQPER